MSETNESSFDSVAKDLMVRTTSEVEYDLFYSVVSCRSKTDDHRQQFCHDQASPVRKNVSYLNIDNLHKIIKRFLIEKGMSKEELARALEITAKNLEQLFDSEIPAGLLCKVNLPLVTLYCSTKWE